MKKTFIFLILFLQALYSHKVIKKSKQKNLNHILKNKKKVKLKYYIISGIIIFLLLCIILITIIIIINKKNYYSIMKKTNKLIKKEKDDVTFWDYYNLIDKEKINNLIEYIKSTRIKEYLKTITYNIYTMKNNNNIYDHNNMNTKIDDFLNTKDNKMSNQEILLKFIKILKEISFIYDNNNNAKSDIILNNDSYKHYNQVYNKEYVANNFSTDYIVINSESGNPLGLFMANFNNFDINSDIRMQKIQQNVILIEKKYNYDTSLIEKTNNYNVTNIYHTKETEKNFGIFHQPGHILLLIDKNEKDIINIIHGIFNIIYYINKHYMSSYMCFKNNNSLKKILKNNINLTKIHKNTTINKYLNDINKTHTLFEYSPVLNMLTKDINIIFYNLIIKITIEEQKELTSL